MIKGKNFTLKLVDKINNDFSGVYMNEKVVALIDTDSNYYQVNPIYKKITDPRTFDYIVSKCTPKELQSISKQVKTKDDLIKLAFVLHHDNVIVAPFVDATLRSFEKEHNCTCNLPWDFEGESEIKTQAVWAKKRYIYETFGGKFTVKGLDVIKTNSSYFIRQELKKLLMDLVANSSRIEHIDNNIFFEDSIKDVFIKYKDISIFNVSNPVGVGPGQWEKYVVDGKPIKGITKSVRALYNFNRVLDTFGDRYANVPRRKEGKIHVFEVDAANRWGCETIGVPFAINEHIGENVLSLLNINYHRQWLSKGASILSSCYEVFGFKKDYKINKLIMDSIFM